MIYMIYDRNTNLKYIGCTEQKHTRIRLHQHVKDYHAYINKKSQKYCTSYKIIQDGNYEIRLLVRREMTREEMFALEQEFIDNTDCVNIKRTKRSVN